VPVESAAQPSQRPRSEEVVGIEREDVVGISGADTCHSRRRRALVDLVDDAHAGKLQAFEHRHGRRIRRAVVDDDNLARDVLVLCGGDSRLQGAAVVEARDDNRDCPHGAKMPAVSETTERVNQP
jgi:hypothetical protein